MRTLFKSALILVSSIIVILGLLLLYWYFRPNSANVDPALKLATWTAVGDGMHNSNTDMIFWKGRFYLVRNSPITATEKCK